MTLLITQEGIFYDKEDLASNKTYHDDVVVTILRTFRLFYVY